ncbi:MAG: cache domain-containing protein [Acidobacteriaceae bacterium]|nr:cache domain-containing protein [Acidobacteriaceae bacterium]
MLALIVVIVPLSVIGLILTQHGDRSLANSVGNDFKTIAQLLSNEVSQAMKTRIADVNTLAKDPVILAAVQGRKAAGKAADKTMLGTPASQMLRERKGLNPQFLSIVVTNQDGDVVAASQQPAKLSYAQDAAWQSVFNNGQGKARISDIVDDEFTKSDYVNIGVPVNDPSSGATIGIVSAAVNVTDLLARFRDAQIGNGARAELVNDDGTIVSGPNADVFAHLRSSQFGAIRDSIGGVQGSESGWLMANLQNGPQIVAYSSTGLKQHFENLGWSVLVSQEEHIAAAPIRGLEHFALVMVILSVFMLTLLFVYYFIHRAQDLDEIERNIQAGQPHSTAASY